MKKLIRNFTRCGVIGWCLEILFTAFGSFRRRELDLKGVTSVWMFPIYGTACLIEPVRRALKGKSVLRRGFTYTGMIFLVEFISGLLLSRRSICPWDYRRSRWHFKRVIRLDYLPYWFCTGLLYERLFAKDEASRQTTRG